MYIAKKLDVPDKEIGGYSAPFLSAGGFAPTLPTTPLLYCALQNLVTRRDPCYRTLGARSPGRPALSRLSTPHGRACLQSDSARKATAPAPSPDLMAPAGTLGIATGG